MKEILLTLLFILFSSFLFAEVEEPGSGHFSKINYPNLFFISKYVSFITSF